MEAQALGDRVSLRRRKIDDQQAHLAVRELQDALDKFTSDGARQIELTLTTGTLKKIPHPLKRAFVGWSIADLVTASTTAGHIQRYTSDGGVAPDNSKEIWLKAVGFSTATVDIVLEVF